MEKSFFKLVRINSSIPFEYTILEEVDKDDLDDVHSFILNNVNKHQNSNWVLIPCNYTIF